LSIEFLKIKINFMTTEVSGTRIVAENSKLRDLFVDQLRDIYWAENKLAKALDRMQTAATTTKLKDAFGIHREQTKGHRRRLEEVFSSISEPVDSSKCPAMAGIIEEANDIIDDTDNETAQRDAGLIIAAQKAEHYEIASYGSLAQLADTLSYPEAKRLLGLTLAEEKATDELLTEIARSGINYSAALEEKDKVLTPPIFVQPV
jgi:ferritin-like metal-binding protein YciE